jgi:SAM-dependent methyltransferase
VTYYRARLARIHAADFTMYARAAADRLLAELGTGSGVILDLGCGAGDLSEAITGAGYDYFGIDLSPDMVALARRRRPGIRVEQGSVFDLPDVGGVRAIVAVGEVVNYAGDPRAGLAGIHAWLRACRRALAPGGLLLLDAAGPLRADPEPLTAVQTGEGYRLEVTTVTDAGRRTLTRTIRIVDDEGEDAETHELELIEPLEILAAMRSAGFTATALSGYRDDLPFPRGWSGFLGRVILDA